MALAWYLICALFAGVALADDTTLEAYPSVVQVESITDLGTWSQSCVASVLTSWYVLSAASCFSGPSYQIEFRRIRAGSSSRNTGGSINYVQFEINHPQWHDSAMNDISVVRLLNSLLYSNLVGQATIAAPGSVIPPGLPVIQLGWGTGTNSEVLTDSTLTVSDLSLCARPEESEEESEETSEETTEETSEEVDGEDEDDSEDGNGDTEEDGDDDAEEDEDDDAEEEEEEDDDDAEEEEEEDDDAEEDDTEAAVGVKRLRTKRQAPIESLLCGTYADGVEDSNADVGGPWFFGNITLGIISAFNALDVTSAGVVSSSVAHHTNWIISVAI